MVLDFDLFLLKDDKVMEVIASIVQSVVDGDENFVVDNEFISGLLSEYCKDIPDIVCDNNNIGYGDDSYNIHDYVSVVVDDGKILSVTTERNCYFDRKKDDDNNPDRDILISALRECAKSELIVISENNGTNKSEECEKKDNPDSNVVAIEKFDSMKDVVRHIINVEGNIPQGLALKEIIQGKGHVFITGRAGSGKSTFMRRIFPFLEKAVIVAPTGAAAINVGGSTIHSCFGMGIDPYCPVCNPTMTEFLDTAKFNGFAYKMKKIKTIIIDEISMVRPDLLDNLADILRQIKFNDKDPFGGVRLIMFGDLSQLPPVAMRDDPLYSYYDSRFFFSSKALRVSGFKIFNFDKVFRQKDPTFLDILDEVKSGEITDKSVDILNSRLLSSDYDIDKAVNLCSTNKELIAINNENLMKINNKEYVFDAIINNIKPSSSPCEERLSLKVGAKVIITKNNMPDYVNGSIGEVVGFLSGSCMEDDDEDRRQIPESWKNDIKAIVVRVYSTGKEVTIYPNTWESYKYIPRDTTIEKEVVGSIIQFPLKLGYAITIHKSQGMTLDKVLIDINKCFESGQVYTALSRCKSLDGIYLKTSISKDMIKKDDTIVNFMDKVRANKGVVMPEKIKDVMGNIRPANQYGIDFNEFGI